MSLLDDLDQIISRTSMLEVAYKPGDRVYLKPGEQPPHGEKVEVGPKGGEFFIWRAGAGHGGWERKRRMARQRARQEADNAGEGVRAEGGPVRGGGGVPGGRPVQRPPVAGADPRPSGEGARPAEGGPEDQPGPAGSAPRRLTPRDLIKSERLRDLGLEGGINEAAMRIVQVPDTTFRPRPGLSDQRAMTKRVEVREAQAELFRFELDDLLGHDTVPDVVEYADAAGADGSSFLMRWVDDAGFGGTDAHRLDYGQVLSPNQLKDFARITVLDAILGNTDRHQGNYLVDDVHNKIWAIDSGFGQCRSVDGISALRLLGWNLPGAKFNYDQESLRLTLRDAAEELKPRMEEIRRLAERRLGRGRGLNFEEGWRRVMRETDRVNWREVKANW